MGEGTYDDQPFEGELPHAEDRLWRHPAERGAAQAAANLEARRVHGRRWPSLVVSFIAGGALVGMIWLFQEEARSPIDVNSVQEITPPTSEAVLGPLSFDDYINEVVALNRESIAGLYLGGEAQHDVIQAIRIGTDGHLITSAHALDGAADIRVVFANGTDTTGRVVATDPVSGIGVIKVNANDLPPPTFGDDNDVSVSDELIVLANPGMDIHARRITVLGDDQVISAPNGDLLSGLFRLSNDLDAGWAGSAVLEDTGGIVAMTVEARNGSHYAVPISRARRIARQLIDTGAVDYKAWLGVEMVDLSDGIKEARGLLGGVLMSRVWDETPAARGGLVAGDIVVGMGDANVINKLDLQLILASLQPGEAIEIRYSRVNAPATEPDAATPEPGEIVGDFYTTLVTVGARPAE